MLLTQGNYKKIMKNRMDKYGSIEPVIENLAMNISSPANKPKIPEVPKGGKNLQMTKQDIEFY